MTSIDPNQTSILPSGRKAAGKWALGFLLLAGLIAWVHWSVGWGTLLRPWADFSLAELSLLVGLTALSYLFRAVRVYDYFHERLKGLFPATLRLSLIHNGMNNFLPMRLGELAYPVLMRRYFGKKYTQSAVSLLWIRLLDLHFLVLLAIMTFTLHRSAGLRLTLMSLWVLAVPLGYWTRGWLHRRLDGRSGRVVGLAVSVLENVPDNGFKFFRIWIWTALSWSVKLVAYVYVVLHFVDIGFGKTMLGIIGGELSSILPIHGVAGAGSYEVAMIAALVPFGVPGETVLKAAVNLHLYLLAVSLALGLAALMLPRPRPGSAAYPTPQSS